MIETVYLYLICVLHLMALIETELFFHVNSNGDSGYIGNEGKYNETCSFGQLVSKLGVRHENSLTRPKNFSRLLFVVNAILN